MLLVGAYHEFMYVDVGTEGCQSDGGIWRECSMIKSIDNDCIDLSEPRNLPRSNTPCEFIIVGNYTFPLGPHLINLFCKRLVGEPFNGKGVLCRQPTISFM